MSGTSLDGLDIVLCRFHKLHGNWHFRLLRSVTYGYSTEWRKKLTDAPLLDAESFMLLHNEYGKYIGNQVNGFLSENDLKAEMVASHGHTIFHQPEKGFTFQLGSGAALAATCKMDVISDFRTFDVALGGQGAPLVPVGDELLFGEYRFCLNLGGFANISNREKRGRIACDLCPVNIVANVLAMRKGKEYDRNGIIGGHGTLMPEIVEELNALDFYSKPAPKSLGREWVEHSFLPVLAKYSLPPEDLLRNVYEHIAFQISRYINNYEAAEVLVTGGGAFNTFLIRLLQDKSKSLLIVPDEPLVKFKEAIVFAFLGLLRHQHEINCLSSVTGALYDSTSGIIHRMKTV